MTPLAALDRLLAAPLRGQIANWDEDALEGIREETVARRMAYHGIEGLLDQSRDLLAGWPSELLDAISEQARAQAFWELRHKAVISTVIETFAQESISSVLLKGTAIAYSYYDPPHARKRGDTDLLISKCSLSHAAALLKRLGWQSLSTTHGAFGDMQYQDLWQYTDPAGFTHDLDLHWMLTNSDALNRVLDTDQLLSNATALPALSPHARIPSSVHLILHGCINQALHANTGYFSIDRQEFAPHRLIWAYDQTLLSASFKSKDWQELTNAAGACGISRVCLEAFEFANEMLGMHVPEDALDRLATALQDTSETRYLQATRGFGRAVEDLKAVPGVGRKLKLLTARAFPTPALLRNKYPDHGNWPIGFLYAKRIVDAFVAPSGRT